jgi:hypothetical protein
VLILLPVGNAIPPLAYTTIISPRKLLIPPLLPVADPEVTSDTLEVDRVVVPPVPPTPEIIVYVCPGVTGITVGGIHVPDAPPAVCNITVY